MNKLEIQISVVRDFARSTGGRIPQEGPNSGQEFRENILVPAFKREPSSVFIDLDGTDGYGSSFLEESFGGLVRSGFDGGMLLKTLSFKSEDDPTYVDEIHQYINDEMKKQ